MAYNHDTSIIIVDTQNWAVKKTLIDEKVPVSALHSYSIPNSRLLLTQTFYFLLRCFFDCFKFTPCFSFRFVHQNKSKYSVCLYSKCGKYIAAGGENGEFSVWDIDANRLIQEDKLGDHEAQCITAIDWNPNNNGELAYTDNTGQFGLIENIIDGDEEDIVERAEVNGMDDDVDYGDSE